MPACYLVAKAGEHLSPLVHGYLHINVIVFWEDVDPHLAIGQSHVPKNRGIN